MLERMAAIWQMIEQRTQQYNELQDQMNLISMECMKTAKIEDQSLQADSSGNYRQIDVIEERYQ